MGASFRNIGQIERVGRLRFLLTISPKLLKELAESEAPMERKLDPEKAKASDMERVPTDEKNFRFLLNQDQMATEKTSDGIRLVRGGYCQGGRVDHQENRGVRCPNRGRDGLPSQSSNGFRA